MRELAVMVGLLCVAMAPGAQAQPAACVEPAAPAVTPPLTHAGWIELQSLVADYKQEMDDYLSCLDRLRARATSERDQIVGQFNLVAGMER